MDEKIVLHCQKCDFKGNISESIYVTGGIWVCPKCLEDVYYQCSTCKMISYHPNDIKYKYCGNCRTFENDIDQKYTNKMLDESKYCENCGNPIFTEDQIEEMKKFGFFFEQCQCFDED